jgi:hypothetical protein
MKSILCFELKRCFGSKRLYLSLLTGIVISLLHIIFGVLPLTQWLSSWQGDFFLTPHSAYGHWIGTPPLSGLPFCICFFRSFVPFRFRILYHGTLTRAM